MTVDAKDLPLHVQRDHFDPPAAVSALRDQPGLERVTDALGHPAWLVTRYDEAREVLGDASRFSNDRLPPIPVPGSDPTALRAGNLLMTDPPEHTRLRRLLTGEFTVKRIRRLQPRIGRAATPHVAFGHGVHHCLGAPLAHMEMATAFPALLQRFPTLSTPVDLDGADFREGTFIYGMRSLPVSW